MKKLIIIPAYNEAENIVKTVTQIVEKAPDFDYVIINDCSVDNTLQICKENNFNVINLPINLGIGGAVQTGYLYACEKEYDLAVQVDGDGQHDQAYIADMIDEMERTGCDIVIGSRFKTERKPINSRMIGSQIINNSYLADHRRQVYRGCDLRHAPIQ